MAETKTMNVRFQQKIDTAENWTNSSIILLAGEIAIESRHDADVIANSTSGDVDVRIVEALETYQVTTHSVSGDCTTSGQTHSESKVPTRNIEAKTISGDIAVRFL